MPRHNRSAYSIAVQSALNPRSPRVTQPGTVSEFDPADRSGDMLPHAAALDVARWHIEHGRVYTATTS